MPGYLARCIALWRPAILGAALLVAGCGSGGGSSAPDPQPGDPPANPPADPPANPPPGNPSLVATFESIQDNVLTPVCTGCHVGAAAPAGLRLDAANSYALLVGVASTEAPSVLRVAPGNPNASYLIQKLEGTAAVGARMPLNAPALAQADIDVIRQWITDGAQAAPAPPPSAPIRLTSLSPLPDSALTALPASITAVFDREPDAATVNATTFLVDRSGGDGTFEDGNEVAVTAASIAVPAANTSSAVFDLTGAPTEEDTYRVRLLGAAAANIQDHDANPLDGEFAGTFPSGDGTAGGDFVATFEFAVTQPTLASIQANVFSPICAGCHAGATPPAGLDLSSESVSYAELVGVAATQVPTLARVQAGDPSASYLIHKIEGAPAIVGQRMPRGGQPPLNQATINAIRQWVTNGANP